MFGREKKKKALTKKQEENIISTICGDTTSFQRTVNAEWVALASATHDIDKVESVVKKYGGKIVNGEIKLDSLRGAGKIGAAYAEIRREREKQMKEYYKKLDAERKATSKSKAAKALNKTRTRK